MRINNQFISLPLNEIKGFFLNISLFKEKWRSCKHYLLCDGQVCRSRWNNGIGWLLLNQLNKQTNNNNKDMFPVSCFGCRSPNSGTSSLFGQWSMTQMCRWIKADTLRWTHRAINKVATVRLPHWTFERTTGRNGVTQSPQVLMVLWLSLPKRTMKKKNTLNFSTFSGLNCPQETKIQSINETHWRILFVFIQTLGKGGTQKIKRKRKTELVYSC